jgi:pre-mRNA 3'-end-processing factor FIP1
MNQKTKMRKGECVKDPEKIQWKCSFQIYSRDEQEKDEDSDDDDDDDDDINVVIGDIKSGGPSVRFDPKQKQPGSKFNIEEFESVGTINGQPSIEFAIESIEDKPWRKPGADITDYFSKFFFNFFDIL